MVQEFHVLRCFSCKTFQVHQVKKGKQWNCKLCGEKQSITKVYGQGTGADCRHHVQKLNMMQGDKQTAADLAAWSTGGQVPFDEQASPEENRLQPFDDSDPPVSRWSKYTETTNVTEVDDKEDEYENMCTDKVDHASTLKRIGRQRKRKKNKDGAYQEESTLHSVTEDAYCSSEFNKKKDQHHKTSSRGLPQTHGIALKDLDMSVDLCQRVLDYTPSSVLSSSFDSSAEPLAEPFLEDTSKSKSSLKSRWAKFLLPVDGSLKRACTGDPVDDHAADNWGMSPKRPSKMNLLQVRVSHLERDRKIVGDAASRDGNLVTNQFAEVQCMSSASFLKPCKKELPVTVDHLAYTFPCIKKVVSSENMPAGVTTVWGPLNSQQQAPLNPVQSLNRCIVTTSTVNPEVTLNACLSYTAPYTVFHTEDDFEDDLS